MFDTTPCLLVVTDDAGIEHLEATGTWKPMALRPDQLEIDQILFFNRDAMAITHLALLNGETPFALQALGDDAPRLWEPQVALATELMDVLPVSRVAMQMIEAHGFTAARNHEAATLEDVDAIYVIDEDEADNVVEYIVSELIDQAILNRRSINVQGGLRWLAGDEGDATLAIEEEMNCQSNLAVEAMDALPETWANVVPEDQAAGLLALLNSIAATPAA